MFLLFILKQFLNKSSNQEDTQSIQTLQKKSSFVSKHIQRRKTIHDTLNIDLLKNFLIEKQQNQNDNSLKTSTLNLNSSKQKQLKSESAKNSPISQKLNASVEHLNNLSKTSKQFKSTLALSSISPISPNKNQTKFDFANVLTNNNTTNVLPVLNRELVKQGHVTLSNVKIYKITIIIKTFKSFFLLFKLSNMVNKNDIYSYLMIYL